MSLLETIRSEALSARKAQNKVSAPLLTTLLSEAEMVGKNDGDRQTRDDEVIVITRKFIKNIEETLSRTNDRVQMEKLSEERVILQGLIPSELSEEELRAAISEIAPGETLTLRDTGRVMAALNERFPGRVSGKAVSAILKG